MQGKYPTATPLLWPLFGLFLCLSAVHQSSLLRVNSWKWFYIFDQCNVVLSSSPIRIVLLYFLRVPIGGGPPPRNNTIGGSPLAKGMTTTIHPGGGSLSSPATATRSNLPFTATPTQVQPQAASPPMNTCLRHSAQLASSQARNTIPTGMYQLLGSSLYWIVSVWSVSEKVMGTVWSIFQSRTFTCL